jgi:hypothetical protein
LITVPTKIHVFRKFEIKRNYYEFSASLGFPRLRDSRSRPKKKKKKRKRKKKEKKREKKY